jgi:NADH-quinone oxidoreductase subunit M
VLFQRCFQGPASEDIADLSARELVISASLLTLLIIFGLYPNLLLSYFIPLGAL